MVRWVRGGIAALAAGVLLLSGCTPAADDSASAGQAEAFPGVYAQTVGWGECGDDFGLSHGMAEVLETAGAPVDTFRCAMIEAPLDWNDPRNHETIALAAVHVPSTGEGEPIGTLTGNPGGPGASGLEYLYGMTVSPGFDRVMEQYDLLGFDPRGIGRSTPVECEEVSEVFEIQLAVCAEAHPLAHSMGTSQVARDMELLRALVSEERLDYLGYSYGTILGATYATLFPERVGRFVLDSAPDATWASPEGHYSQSVAFAREVLLMLEGCGEVYRASSCPIGTEPELVEMIERLNAQPLVASDGTEVDGAALYDYLASGLYGMTAGRSEALDTVGRALAGESAAIDGIAADVKGGGATVSTPGMIVGCHSFPADPDIVGLLERIEEEGIPRLLGGPEIDDDTLRQFTDISCGALPESGDDLTAFAGPPETTILVVGITGDHATPYDNGRELARELGNTRFVTLDGHGHGASFSERSTCVDDAVTAFLLRGELPDQDLRCSAD